MSRERVSRLVSLIEAVDVARLTGPQRVEAKMLDMLSPVLISRTQFQGPDGVRRMTAFLNTISSMDDFEERFQQSFGESSLVQFKEMVVAQYGSLNGLNPESTDAAIRMNLLAWARKPQEAANPFTLTNMSRPRPENMPGGATVPVVIETRGKNGWRQTTKAGLPKGPGSHREKIPRKLKRRNGRGRAGKGHVS